MPIDARPDHVAAAVPAIAVAAERWVHQLGGGWVNPPAASPAAGFTVQQVRYTGGGKLELLEPHGPDSFVTRYLDRFGAGIHHVTFKVPALAPALDALHTAGYDVVDVSTSGDAWHEAFLRPSQVGGLIVQLAWARYSDQAWAESLGGTSLPPRSDAMTLLGPRLRHPDPDAATRLWSLLGGEVVRDGEMRTVRWAGSPLDIEVVPDAAAGPVGLRVTGAPALAADATHGPCTLPVPRLSSSRPGPAPR